MAELNESQRTVIWVKQEIDRWGKAPPSLKSLNGLLRRLGFRVTVNTDNRLMSDTSMSREMQHLADAFGWGLPEFQWLTLNAMKSAFLPFDQRLRLIDQVIKPGYAMLRDEVRVSS